MRCSVSLGVLAVLAVGCFGEEEFELWQGDIQVPKSRGMHSLAAMGGDNLWPLCEIPYEIVHDSYLTTENSNRIHEAIKMWTDRIPAMNFRPRRSSDRSYLHFMGKNEGGGDSPLGNVGKNNVRIGPHSCPSGCVAHEIGHSLGLAHEQSRNDRDDFVIINYQNMQSGAASQYDKYTREGGQDVLPYDYNSLMHYTTATFSKGDGYPTLKTPAPVGQRAGPSAKDVEAIRFLYNDCKAYTGKPKCRASVDANADGSPRLIAHSRKFMVTFVGVAGDAVSVSFKTKQGGQWQSGLPSGAQPYPSQRGGNGLYHTAGRIEFTPPSSLAGQTFTLAAEFSSASGTEMCELEVKVADSNAVCFGLSATDPKVCSGNGKCTGEMPFPCNCNSGFGGTACQAPQTCSYNLYTTFDTSTNGWGTTEAEVTTSKSAKGGGSLKVMNQIRTEFPEPVQPERVTYYVATPMRDQASSFGLRKGSQSCVSTVLCQENCGKGAGQGQWLFQSAFATTTVKANGFHFFDLRMDWGKRKVSLYVDGKLEVADKDLQCDSVDSMIFFANLGKTAPEPSYVDDVRMYCYGHTTQEAPGATVDTSLLEEGGLHLSLKLEVAAGGWATTAEGRRAVVEAVAKGGDAGWESAVRGALYEANVRVDAKDGRRLVVGPLGPMRGVGPQRIVVSMPATATTIGEGVEGAAEFEVASQCAGKADGTGCDDGVAGTVDTCRGGKCVGKMTCPATCHGQTCDDWSSQGYKCTQLASGYGCNCGACACKSDPEWKSVKPCKAPSSLGAGYDTSRCAEVFPGQGCPVVCSAGWKAGAAVFRCPEGNSDAATEVQGEAPRCSSDSGGSSPPTPPTPPSTVGCAGLSGAGGAGTDVSGCASGVAAGATCTVRCANGYSGASATYRCPAGNTDARKQPEGTAPVCTPTNSAKGCAALSLGAAFDASGCVGLAAGATCEVRCASGYAGTATTYTCPADNTDASRAPTGNPPTCTKAAGAGCKAPSLGQAHDASGCASGVAAGQTCEVRCASGYEGGAATFSCPASNTDPNHPVEGQAPACKPKASTGGSCPSTCYGATCNDYVKQGYTCDTLIQYSCDCSGCSACEGGPAPPAPTPAPPASGQCKATCHGQTCDYWVERGYACDALASRYSCDCNGCKC